MMNSWLFAVPVPFTSARYLVYPHELIFIALIAAWIELAVVSGLVL